MQYRTSSYIDFKTGTVKVPPMALIQSLGPRERQSIEQMLVVFECRVDVWQLGPAVEMLKLMDSAQEQTSVWAHAGYTLLVSGDLQLIRNGWQDPQSGLDGLANLEGRLQPRLLRRVSSIRIRDTGLL